MIAPERVADGERQATLDILWRIFLDLQVGLVISCSGPGAAWASSIDPGPGYAAAKTRQPEAARAGD